VGSASAWQPDILGEGFEQRTLDLGADDEGPVVATLVRHLPRRRLPDWLWPDRRPLRDVDVLYVHGWSDYFFQTRLARYFAERGARFFALDLRKYGRSLREGQRAGFVTDLATYDEDIAAALEVIRADGPSRRLVLFGHSTGGLTLSLWTSRHPGEAAALVLNSPWLEFQLRSIGRAAITPALGVQARLRRNDIVPAFDLGFYARAQREVYDESDPYEIREAWRPDISMPVHAAWLKAVLAGHAKVRAGLGIDVPVCVLLSARSAVPRRWSEALTRADTVLFVDVIAEAALEVGSSVTIERIDGALHDVFLSRHEARELAYARLDRWITGFVARTR